MLSPVRPSANEIIIKGSRFLSESFLIESQAQVREILKSQKQKYKDSTHVVHAFIAGKNGEFMGMSDDGEPGGTAGRPILDVLKGKNCTNIMITVTRWFGGTLLGTGGLVHAYGDSAKLLLEKMEFEELVEKSEFSLDADYSLYKIIKKIFETKTLYDFKEEFGETVKVTAKIAAGEVKSLEEEIFDKTSGRTKITISAPPPA